MATKKVPGKKFVQVWAEQKMDKNYDEAKQLLVMAANLTFPDPNLPLALTCDASKTSCGAVLEQYEKGAWRPIGYWSKNLPADKRRWTVFRRELLAIKDAIRHFISEIDGCELIVFTDHKALVSAFQNQSMQHDVIAQNHIQEISLWTHDVRFLAGKVNTVADMLSRPSGVPMGPC